MEYGSVIVILLDKDLRIIDYNKGMLNLAGEMEGPEGKLLESYLPEESTEQLKKYLSEKNGKFKLGILGQEGGMQMANIHAFFLEDEYLMIWEITPLTAPEIIEEFSVLNNELTNTIRELNKKNIELKKANETINKLLRIDPLTEMYNRRFFIESLEKAFALMDRSNIPSSLVMADLDDFKNINDSWGHDVGDKVLKTFSKILLDISRKEDVPARIGGEEFMILLHNTDCKNAEKFARRVMAALNRESIPPVNYSISASLGVTRLREDDSVTSVMTRVDKAMYKAKSKGKNRVEIIN